MIIIDLTRENIQTLEQVASLLMEGFRDSGTLAWANHETAMSEVVESLQPRHISRIAIDEEGNVLGWIGGIAEYNGNVWELHPLVVHQKFRKQGIGRELVLDFEKEVIKHGGHTIQLGTDDENNRTSVGGVNLYPGVLKKLRNIKNRNQHPFEFYQKVGFEIVGIIPDANGFGKPDILMAKRISNPK
jgi:aminoglycoside 6'-N-acetyltransferase I